MILGVVGARGRWGRNYLRAADDCGLRALPIDRDMDMRDVDAVAVAIPPRDAIDVGLEVLRRGLPLIIEKPAGLSLSDAQLLEKVARVTNDLVLVAHQHLFAARFEELRQHALVDGNIDGCAEFGGPGPVRDYSALWDYGPHAASVALALTGEFTSRAVATTGGSFCVDGPRGVVECEVSNCWGRKTARVTVDPDLEYNGYAPAEPALTRMLRRFVQVMHGHGSDEDYRFGARWAVKVAEVIEAAQAPIGSVTQPEG